MAFKLKSGNKTSFKNMGSPTKHGTTDDFLYGENGHNPDIMEGKHEDWHTDKIEAEKKKPSPGKHYVDDVKDHNDGHSDDLQTPEEHEKGKVKSQYEYKINGKPVTKAEYIKYQNKPGGDEPGKQTNDPDVYGRSKTK